MSFPNPELDYHLYIDASEYAIGATLNQPDEHERMQLISCMSKKLSPAERNYPTHEREFLALLSALKKWRHYLLGPRVIVHTDNVALRHWKTAPNLSPRIIRWIADIEQYNLTFEHIPGASNTAADALSRYPLNPMIVSPAEDSWLTDYKSDPVTLARYFNEDGSLLPTAPFKRGRIWDVDRIVVPTSRVQEVLRNHHSSTLSGHWSTAKMRDLVERR